jgi:hypothetical protein
MEFLRGIVFVCANTRDQPAESCDIGGYVVFAANAGLPRTIAADHKPSSPGFVVVREES